MRHPAIRLALLILLPLTVVMAQQPAGSAAARGKAAAAPASAARTAAGLIDINTASKQELSKISGIGPAYAARIIKGRPYARKDQLLTKRVLPKKVYDAIKNRIVANH